jgi:hypothetical protein
MNILAGLWSARHEDRLAQVLPGWLNAALIGGMLATALWLERRRPLRPLTERQANHDIRNLAMAILSAGAIRITAKPVTDLLTLLAFIPTKRE